MPYIETPEELADHLADLLGIYEDPKHPVSPAGDHMDGCKCRMCWVSVVADRMRRAVKNEAILEARKS